MTHILLQERGQWHSVQRVCHERESPGILNWDILLRVAKEQALVLNPASLSFTFVFLFMWTLKMDQIHLI